ncbi:MAG: hypothetical protein GXP34_06540 [Actinobacteria bacterium]|nr:hypothetical protein [Actinomycetota bacterium]
MLETTHKSHPRETAGICPADSGNGSCPVEELHDRMPVVRMAHDGDTTTAETLDARGAGLRTAHGFVASTRESIRVIRERFMLPTPYVR